jgi:hypothetical protein
VFEALFVQNGMEEGDALSPLLFNLCFECTVVKVQGNKEEV